MRAPQVLQLIGLVLGFVGAVFLTIAYQSSSEVHGAQGQPLTLPRARWLVPAGLALVALGFALQAAGIFAEAYR